MKVMTFNVQHCYNYILEKVDYEMLASEIKQVDADVVGLNEIFSGDENSLYGNQIEKIAKLAGYPYFYFAKAIELEKGPYGNAVLSKIPFETIETIVVPSPEENKKNPDGYYETRCLLVIKLVNGKKVIITHFGLNEDEVEKEINVLLNYLDSSNCIFMGDLNSLFEDEILTPIKDVMKDAAKGFCQNFMTFPSYDPKIKIDYIFVSPDLKVEDAYVLEKVLSDHFAHIAVIED